MKKKILFVSSSNVIFKNPLPLQRTLSILKELSSVYDLTYLSNNSDFEKDYIKLPASVRHKKLSYDTLQRTLNKNSYDHIILKGHKILLSAVNLVKKSPNASSRIIIYEDDIKYLTAVRKKQLEHHKHDSLNKLLIAFSAAELLVTETGKDLLKHQIGKDSVI